MPVFDIYHKRKITESGGWTDIFTYDNLPEHLRTQLKQIFRDAIGPCYPPTGYASLGPNNNEAWANIVKILRREFGVDALSSHSYGDGFEEVGGFISLANVDHALSAIECCCRWIERMVGRQAKHERQRLGIIQDPQDALNEVNERFRLAGVGYSYADSKIIRVDSALVHSEVVLPSLKLLSDKRFAGADAEFREAFDKYRAGDVKGAVVAANCAFESTLKTICAIHGWEVSSKSRASDLIKTVRQNGLFPSYLDKAFDQLQSFLASGLPEIRNHSGGHGQGQQVQNVPDFVGAYALHLAASSIVFVCAASNELEKPSPI